MSRPRSQQWVIRGSIAGAAISLVVAACVTNEHPRITCADFADGGPGPVDPTDGSTYFVEPSTDAQPPEALGMEPDPGPSCTNCQQGDDLEIMLVSDFEDGYGPAWINYGEPGAVVLPRSVGKGVGVDGGTVQGPPQPYFGLQATDLRATAGGARCDSSYALHLEGGPFVSWGGGYATQFMTVRGAVNAAKYCSPDTDPSVFGIGVAPQLIEDKTCRFFSAPASQQPSLTGIDVGAFDGIALWARRGPGGASTLRVALVDVNTAQESALNAELKDEEPACRRVVSCCRGCTNVHHVVYDMTNATLSETDDMRCHDETEPLPRFQQNGDVVEVKLEEDSPWTPVGDVPDVEQVNNVWRTWDQTYNTCCPATPDLDPKYGDPKRGGGNVEGECAPYVFKYDFSSGNYCQLPGEMLPEKNDNRCEDAFESNIIVDTEWKLFTIPWAELRRSTLGRPPVDPRSIWTIRLYPTAGWLDTYVDDIGFYRKKQ